MNKNRGRTRMTNQLRALLTESAPDAQRWVAGRSVVAWRGPEEKQIRDDRPRLHALVPVVIAAPPACLRLNSRRGPRRRAPRGRVAPPPAPWPAQRLLPCVGVYCGGQRLRRGSRQRRAPRAPGPQRGGSRCQVVVQGMVVPRARHPWARYRVSHHLPRPIGRCSF